MAKKRRYLTWRSTLIPKRLFLLPITTRRQRRAKIREAFLCQNSKEKDLTE
jgi:hypothetical protein